MLRAADEFNVSLFASDPMITNPAAIDVDTQGRVWVAEIQWYRGKAKNPPADKIKVLDLAMAQLKRRQASERRLWPGCVS
jgi:hypothetical protein